MVAPHDEQARFFGLLEGGRGFVEASIYTLATATFTWFVTSRGASDVDALQNSILVFVVLLFALAPIVYMTLNDSGEPLSTDDEVSHHVDTWSDLKDILQRREVWLAALIIFAGYHLFYATYSFSAFLQTELQVAAVVAGWIGVARMWMRPLVPVIAGFIGDKWHVSNVLAVVMLLAAVNLAAIAYLPASSGMLLILFTILAMGALTFAIRGLYWGTLEDCSVSMRARGLASRNSSR